MRIMLASAVSHLGGAEAKAPVLFRVAPMTSAPGLFSTGSDSPVIIDSSTALLPSSTFPSTGIFSPGRTTTVAYQDLFHRQVDFSPITDHPGRLGL